jgi:hypothetical protein
LAATGTVASASPPSALASTSAVATVHAEGAVSGDGVTTTDTPSGISVMLPGQPTVKKTTTAAADGTDLPLRQYLLALNGGNEAVLSEVGDAAFRTFHADKGLQGVFSRWPGGTITSSRHLDINGHPAIDGRLTATMNGTPAVCLIRIVSDNGYVVRVFTLGRVTEENDLTALHQQVIDTLRLI